jgi:hypothetical protein
MDRTEYDWDIEVDEDVDEDETTRVLEWRQYRWLALGYSIAGAAVLACAPIDIHDVERLIERGCPLDLAVKIAG